MTKEEADDESKEPKKKAIVHRLLWGTVFFAVVITPFSWFEWTKDWFQDPIALLKMYAIFISPAIAEIWFKDNKKKDIAVFLIMILLLIALEWIGSFMDGA